jgi:uncharacterized caspase-like protein
LSSDRTTAEAAVATHTLFGDAVFFVLRAQDAVDRVGGAAARFVVVANLHFSQQTNREKI